MSDGTLPDDRPPVGILAAILALAIAVAGLTAGQDYATQLARQYLLGVSDRQLSIKWEGLVFQRAALEDGHYLPIYGSSELYCCGEPYYATQVFASQPTGFDAFAVGGLGTGDLLFLQTLAALGTDLRGKKLVLSESPPYFFLRGGIRASYYAGNFSPEIAAAFLFDSPISLDLREGGAKRMLDYPDTLADQPLLRLGATALADPSPLHLAEYVALYPAGHLHAWVLQLQDAWQTVQFVERHPELRAVQPDPPPTFDWPLLLDDATTTMAQRSRVDPFGFPEGEFQRVSKEERETVTQALALFCSGRTNRYGEVYPEPVEWEQSVLASAEWRDLALEVRILQELGADPLVWSLPLPGVFDDFTPLSERARQTYYRKYRDVVAQFPGVRWLEFSAHDEDRYFLTDTSAHFSARGWIFVNRALDLYWHDQPMDTVRSALAELYQHSPPVGAPAPSPAYCGQAPTPGG